MARIISAPVGAKGSNKAQDVKVIQGLLNAARQKNSTFKSAGIDPLPENGVIEPNTIAAIRTYQQKVMGWQGSAVDGTVHPNRMTWKSLNGNVGAVRGEPSTKEVCSLSMAD